MSAKDLLLAITLWVGALGGLTLIIFGLVAAGFGGFEGNAIRFLASGGGLLLLVVVFTVCRFRASRAA